jgi:hypothetical protein
VDDPVALDLLAVWVAVPDCLVLFDAGRSEARDFARVERLFMATIGIWLCAHDDPVQLDYDPVELDYVSACLSCSFMITSLSIQTCSSSRSSVPSWLPVSSIYSGYVYSSTSSLSHICHGVAIRSCCS